MDLQPGQMLSQYRLVERTGEGGMGVVWKAFDTSLDREVALKILAPHVADDPEILERFQREAKAVAALNHPNIVTIHAVEEIDGVRFIAMELLKGSPLSEVIPEGGVSLERFFDLAVPLADALRTAHERGITHRDLKPANIMVDPDGRPKILDFGLAKLRPERDQEPEEASSTSGDVSTQALTREGRILGTMPYMSPEQARGDVADARSDIFSLGIIYYELATGSRPFRGKTAADLISSILRDRPRAVTSLCPKLPRRLDAILDTCLEKNPDRRYSSTIDLRNDLEGLKAEVSTGHATLGPPPLRRNRKTLLAAAGVVAVLMLLAIFAGRFVPDPSPPLPPPITVAADSVAVLPFVNMSAEEHEYFAEGMTEELINALAKVDGLQVPARTSVYALRNSGLTVREIGTQLGVGTALEGSVRIAGNRLRVSVELIDVANGFQIWSETYDRQMEDIFLVQDEISRAIVDRLRIQLAGNAGAPLVKRSTESLEAYDLYMRGRHFWNERSVDGLEKAVGLFSEAAAEDPNFALAYAGLADAYVLLPEAGDLDGEEIFPRAKEAALRALELNDELAEAHTSLGQVLRLYEGNYEAAEEELRRAIQLDPAYATGHHWLGVNLFLEMERADEGLAHMQLAEKLDPLSSVIKFSLAGVMRAMGRIDQAIQKYRELQGFDPAYPVYNALSSTYFQNRMFAESVETLRMKRERTALTLADWTSLTGTLHLHGDHEEELKEARRARKEFPENWNVLSMEARALIGLNRLDDLWRTIERGIALGTSLTAGPHLLTLAGELSVHGHPRHAERMAASTIEWYEWIDTQFEVDLPANPAFRLALAMGLLSNGQVKRARTIFDRAASEDQLGARTLPEDKYLGYSGSLAALTGARDRAEAFEKKLVLLAEETGRPGPLFWRAAVVCNLQEPERAVELLRQAFDEGFWTYGRAHRDPLFAPLWGFKPYRDLLEELGLPLPVLGQ